MDFDLIRYYEQVLEKREALWILSGRNGGRIHKSRKEFLLHDVKKFVEDLPRLPFAFRLMASQCLLALLKKYGLPSSLPLQLEVDGAPLAKILGEDLSEWQITLKEKILAWEEEK